MLIACRRTSGASALAIRNARAEFRSMSFGVACGRRANGARARPKAICVCI
jgi:hypothetical protein